MMKRTAYGVMLMALSLMLVLSAGCEKKPEEVVADSETESPTPTPDPTSDPTPTPDPSLPTVSVSSLSPQSGSIAGGTTVSIVGSGFTGGTFAVTLNDVTCASPVVISDTELRCTSGVSDNPKAGDLKVTRQQDSQVMTAAGVWEYLQPQTPFTWTGAGGNHLWNNSANWAGGAVPNSNSDVVFSGSWCSGSACNVTLNTSVQVKSLKMRANFTGTISEDQSFMNNSDVIIGSNAADEAFRIDGGTWQGHFDPMGAGGYRKVMGIARFTGGTMNFENAFNFYSDFELLGGTMTTDFTSIVGAGTNHIKATVPIPQLEILNDDGGHVEITGTIQTNTFLINSAGTCNGSNNKVLGGTLKVTGDIVIQATCGGTTTVMMTNPGHTVYYGSAVGAPGGIFPGTLALAPSSAGSFGISLPGSNYIARFAGGLTVNSGATLNLGGVNANFGGPVSIAGTLDANGSGTGGTINVDGDLSVQSGGTLNKRSGTVAVTGQTSNSGTIVP